jgi:signal transduction histidine kinase
MSIVLGKNVDLKFFYLSVALIPLIVFGKKERRFLYLSFFITAANISLIYFTQNSYNPRYSYDPEVYKSISIAINIIAVLCLIVMSFIFLHLTEAGEAEAHTLNMQLLKKQEELMQSKEELDRINQLKDHLFKIMTHDLKSPLNNIAAMAELMMNEKISRDEIKFLSERFKQTADNTTQMLDNILSWSVRQITQKAPETFSLTALVNRVFAQIQDKAEVKKISLMNQIPENVMVTTDPEMLEIVLRNLLTNSIKFTNLSGQVRVDSIGLKNRFVLRVEDNGIGIPKMLLQNLFGNNRLSSRVGTNMEKGSGIGLLLCKQLVESCQGKIAIQSEEGRFTIVTLELPSC